MDLCDTETCREDSESKFKKTLRQIITLAPKVQCPQEQQVLHEWVERLMEPPCTDDDQERRLEYARYLMFQLKRGKLHLPFLESPCPGTLKALDELLTTKHNEDLQAGALLKPQSVTDERRQSFIEGKTKCKPIEDEASRNAVRLLELIQCFNIDNIILENFIIAIGPYTRDKAKFLSQILINNQISYKAQVEELYREKEIKISMELAKEQAGIPERYKLAKQRMLSRAMAGLNFIKSQAPTFQYSKWMENPEYLRNMFKLNESGPPASGGGAGEPTDESLDAWERKTLQMFHDVNSEAERIEEANTDKEKEIQELIAQSTALEQDFTCKKSKLARRIQELESEKFGYAIANDERDRVIEHLLQDMQNVDDDEDDGVC